jgi:hypothetical protein
MTATADQLFDRLTGLVSNERHHRLMGREALAASYRPLISEVCDEINALGGDVIEWLDAAGAD